MSGLGEKVCVVTGASGGIGEATARALAARGATVVLAARRARRLEEIAEGIGRVTGRPAIPVTCDVGDVEQVQVLVDRVKGDHGRCDVLVNNAGVPGGGAFADISLEQIEHVVQVNLLGVVYCTRLFLPLLQGSKGHVVNVASLAGRYALPGAAVYTATKHAVVAFSESLYDLRDLGIRVTVVCPGFVQTEGFPHVRPPRLLTITAEQVAAKIVYVVREDRVGIVNIPAWTGPLAAFQSLTPRLYRFVVARAAQRYRAAAGARPASKGER